MVRGGIWRRQGRAIWYWRPTAPCVQISKHFRRFVFITLSWMNPRTSRTRLLRRPGRRCCWKVPTAWPWVEHRWRTTWLNCTRCSASWTPLCSTHCSRSTMIMACRSASATTDRRCLSCRPRLRRLFCVGQRRKSSKICRTRWSRCCMWICRRSRPICMRAAAASTRKWSTTRSKRKGCPRVSLSSSRLLQNCARLLPRRRRRPKGL